MSFDLGFRLLQDMFPQVDRRMLKAVAIEHSTDVEAAVECIINEVLPSIRVPPQAPHTLIDGQDDKHLSIPNSEPPQDVGTEEPKHLLEDHEAVQKEIVDDSELGFLGFIPSEHSDSVYRASQVPDVGSFTFVGEEKISSVSNTLDEEHSHQLRENAKTEHQEAGGETKASLSEFTLINEHNNSFHNDKEGPDCSSTFVLEENSGSSLLNAHDRDHSDQLVSSPVKHQENVLTGSQQGLHALPDSMLLDDVFFECKIILPENNLDLIESEEKFTNLSNEILPAAYSNYLGEDFGLINYVSHDPEESQGHSINFDTNFQEDHFTSLSCEALNVSTTNEMEDVAVQAVQLEPSHVFEKTQEFVTDASSRTTSASDVVSEKMIHDTKLANYEDECFSKAVVTQSRQMCRVDVLEDAITEAKSNKKTLFASLDSVILMMKEVEDLEKAAEHAKEEAFRGGLDILAKVEDLRKMLLRAKEANEMHAGEVYGEKAILATEARELQSRLQNLSYERERSLSILNEMRRALEARIVAAEEVRKTAEQVKLDKEGSAREALKEQEIVMEKVVQDSKRLQSEAEENSELREFLIDQGQIVDILQGEMGVICKDVESLKENFEKQVPVSEILSLSQTSCILASSGQSEVLSSSQTDCILASSGSSSQVHDTSESPKLTNTAPPSAVISMENGVSGWKEFVYKEPTSDDDWNFIEADVVD